MASGIIISLKSISCNTLLRLSNMDKMLGQGVYVSQTLAKAETYGPVIFRLLVYPGHTCAITEQVKFLGSDLCIM